MSNLCLVQLSENHDRTGQIHPWLELRNMIRYYILEILLICLGQVLGSPRGNHKISNLHLLLAGIEATLAQIQCSEMINHNASEVTVGNDVNLCLRLYSDILLNQSEFYLALYWQLTCFLCVCVCVLFPHKSRWLDAQTLMGSKAELALSD